VHVENIQIALSVKLRSTLIGIVFKFVATKNKRFKHLAKNGERIAHTFINSQREFAEPFSCGEKQEL
jgi:hypothetical protein